MATISATGSSTKASTAACANEATRQAMGAFGEGKPSFGFLFASTKHDLGVALRAARDTSGCADIIGCTTAGEITERGATKGGIAVLLVASEETLHDIRVTRGLKEDWEAASRNLTAGFAGMVDKARASKYSHSTTVTLIDGLSGVGERIVDGLMKGTRAFQQVVGGAAGDDGNFEATFVGTPAESGVDAAVALHAFSSRQWGVGVDHGLRPSSDKMTVTRADKNVVFEIDDRPAFEVYRDHAKERGIDLTPDNAGPFMINNELGVYFFNQLQRARAPLSVGEDGSLTCAAEIATGSTVSILDGRKDDLVEAAHNAATEAKKNLDGGRAAAVLLFDCICRGAILDDQFDRELSAVRSVFPDTPMAGFLTYGEIARFKGKFEGWHNTTAVVCAIPA